MISLDKCKGSCNNAADDLSAKICVLSKTKSVNVEVLNMITGLNEAKTAKYSKSGNSNEKCNNETCQCDCKTIKPAKKNIAGS